MKRTLFILGVLISFNAYGDAITGDTCGDDCSWRLENGVLTVTGSGRIKGYNRDCSNLESTGRCTTDAPWFDYAENIEKVVIQNKSDNEKFETIGHNAFEDMFYTKEIILPEGIKTIENEAFHGNVALETINLPNTLETISSWGLSSTNLSEINIPDSVTAIGTAAFTSSSLQSLNIPNGATIYGRISDSCEQLETVVSVKISPLIPMEKTSRFLIHLYFKMYIVSKKISNFVSVFYRILINPQLKSKIC